MIERKAPKGPAAMIINRKQFRMVNMTLYINEISIEKKVYNKLKFPEGSLNKKYNYGDMCIGHDDSRVFLYNRNTAIPVLFLPRFSFITF